MVFISHAHSFIDQLIISPHKRHVGNYISLRIQTDKVSFMDIFHLILVCKLTQANELLCYYFPIVYPTC